ncbi:uncharacterized protein LOC134244665 [Saccostrea cucullata]|uniref:uncharacterized protein LOC134244665 n=1 Tax=Saccostrea cuccullata TaxID=36930 RepID=UPI002ED620E9
MTLEIKFNDTFHFNSTKCLKLKIDIKNFQQSVSSKMDSGNTTHRRRCSESLSESVFIGLCKIHELGTPQQLAMRRDIIEVMNIVQNYLEPNKRNFLWCGSHGEGFRFVESDMDIMEWPTNYRVFWERSQIQYNNTKRFVPILTDSSESPPGFTLLWLHVPIPEAHSCVLFSSLRMKERLYISSSKYIEKKLLQEPTCVKHGPCTLNIMEVPRLEIDHAHSFASDLWPPSASSWIDRCHMWPQPHVVDDIIRSGCHFVAIGHKLGNHENNEWRISFSLAEQKLVFSMNHCQFLTYGLLKWFLNKVINCQLSEERKSLCSYHIKTAIFWVLQENIISQWTPQNLLECFWVCFKLILKWVYEGVCPNFFIPENNMFHTNIHGGSQDALFIRLYTLYERGLSCLFQSPSIRYYIMNELCNPRLPFCINESTLMHDPVFAMELFQEIHENATLNTLDLISFIKALQKIEKLAYSLLTNYHIVMLQNLSAIILQQTAFSFYNLLHSSIYMYNDNNKEIYIFDKISCHMLKMAAKFGCISAKLYLAMYHYRTCRYREALSVIERTKVG